MLGTSPVSTAMAALAMALWAVSGVLNQYRLVRYFQLEGYDGKRFWRVLVRQVRERNYIGLSAITAFVLFLLASFASSGVDDDINRTVEVDLVVSVIALIVVLVDFALRPKDRAVKQKFARTQRAVRLLITAYLIPALFLAAFFVRFLFVRDARTSILIWSLGVAGGALLHFAPLTLRVANAINWPIEEAFRQYYLRTAKQHLKNSGATVIAITGSYGKTSTKHYLQHILEGRFRTLMTPKSFNTLLGISRVINDILAKDVSYEYFIVETDAYFVGENARICKLVEPQIGMVMTVGPMHLERLGSMENIAKAQYEVIEALPPNGIGVFNGDDPQVREMSTRGYPETRLVVTQNDATVSGATLVAANIRMTPEGLDFDVRDTKTGESRSMHAPLYGEHNVTNILMAAQVAHHLGMSLAEIAMRVATLGPADHRLIRRVMPDGTILIDDSYSANPVGTKTALDVLALEKSRSDSRRVVISSGMFELGPKYEEENRKLGQRIADVATDVILIGSQQTRPVTDGLQSRSFPPDHVHVVNAFNEAVEIYKGLLRPGDALLILTDLPDTYA